MRRLARTYWNIVYLLEGTWSFLMKRMGGNRRKKFYNEMWGNVISQGGLWKSCGTLHMWWSYRNFWIHLVNIWWILDWILSQNCRNTLPLHTVDQLVSSAKKQVAVVAGGDEMCENSNLLHGLTFDSTMWWSKDLCAWRRTENTC